MRAAIGLLLSICLPAAQAGINVETLSVEREVIAGEVYSGSIAVTNTGEVSRQAVVYQTDYSFASDGSNDYGSPGESARSNARWITFSPRRVELPPYQTIHISYEIRVPADTTLTGTYWSMLMVEETDVPFDTLGLKTRNQASVRQVVRYGIQCITHIEKTGSPELGFTGSRLVADGNGNTELQVDVENKGIRWAVPMTWMELYDETGRPLGRFEGQKKRIFPGTSVRFRMNLGAPPSGRYKALVVLDSGDQDVIGAKYDLEF